MVKRITSVHLVPFYVLLDFVIQFYWNNFNVGCICSYPLQAASLKDTYEVLTDHKSLLVPHLELALNGVIVQDRALVGGKSRKIPVVGSTKLKVSCVSSKMLNKNSIKLS